MSSRGPSNPYVKVKPSAPYHAGAVGEIIGYAPVGRGVVVSLTGVESPVTLLPDHVEPLLRVVYPTGREPCRNTVTTAISDTTLARLDTARRAVPASRSGYVRTALIAYLADALDPGDDEGDDEVKGDDSTGHTRFVPRQTSEAREHREITPLPELPPLKSDTDTDARTHDTRAPEPAPTRAREPDAPEPPRLPDAPEAPEREW